MKNDCSPMLNLTAVARDKFRLDQGVEMQVEIYDEGIFVRRKDAVE